MSSVTDLHQRQGQAGLSLPGPFACGAEGGTSNSRGLRLSQSCCSISVRKHRSQSVAGLREARLCCLQSLWAWLSCGLKKAALPRPACSGPALSSRDADLGGVRRSPTLHTGIQSAAPQWAPDLQRWSFPKYQTNFIIKSLPDPIQYSL